MFSTNILTYVHQHHRQRVMHQMASCYFMPPQDGNKISPPPCRALLTCRCLTRLKMGSFSYFLSECGGFTSVQCLRFHEEKIISLLSFFGVIDGSLFSKFLLFNFSLSEVFSSIRCEILNTFFFFFLLPVQSKLHDCFVCTFTYCS